MTTRHQLKHEFRKVLMQQSHDARTRIFVDLDATKFDAGVVTLLDTEMSVYDAHNEGWTYERLIAECHRTGAWLRASPAATGPIPHPGHLIPFVDVLLTDRSRISAQTRMSALTCVIESDHTNGERAMERVAALGEAANLIDFLEAKQRRAK